MNDFAELTKRQAENQKRQFDIDISIKQSKWEANKEKQAQLDRIESKLDELLKR